jgi:4-amino-4-deoxy-L-arabinose transferase-like glycosyltransferase
VATDAETFRRARLERPVARISWPRWSTAAWGAIAVGVAFIAFTCWWLSQDRSIPVYDAGAHLEVAIDVHAWLSSGALLHALTGSAPYPPLTYLVGALGIFVGGVGVAPPIIAQNVVFVLALALGCYKVGCLAFNRTAGLLAVIFALGSPLIIEQFHEFMLDAPEAGMVAVAVWAILATERFSRVNVSALAGVAVGLGMLSKETFVFFVAGVALVTALRGGRRAWRGIAVFAAIALVLTLPWYLDELSRIHTITSETLSHSGKDFSAPVAPPRLSSVNLEWYFWSVVNWQLFLPMFAFVAVGSIWAIVGLVRRRPFNRFTPELLLGAFISWVALTATYPHDLRYSVPMTIYFAVLGVGWVSRLARAPQLALAGVLALVALANLLGVAAGVGEPVAVGAPSPIYEQQPHRLTFYSNYGVWLGPPARDGNLLGLMRALHRNGVRTVRWYPEQGNELEFSFQGIAALGKIAGLGVPGSGTTPAHAGRDYAFLRPGVADEPGLPSPCIVLRDGEGVWVRLGGDQGREPWGYCPRGVT